MTHRRQSEASATYCHCYPVFACKPATCEVEGEHGVWFPVCTRCQEIAWEKGLRVRKLVDYAQRAIEVTCPSCGARVGVYCSPERINHPNRLRAVLGLEVAP